MAWHLLGDRQANIWTSGGNFIDAYMRHSASNRFYDLDLTVTTMAVNVTMPVQEIAFWTNEWFDYYIIVC